MLGAHHCLMEGHDAGRALCEALFCSFPELLEAFAVGTVGQKLVHHVFEQSPMPTNKVCGRAICVEKGNSGFQ